MRLEREKEITIRLLQTANALQTFIDRLVKGDNLTAKQFYLMIIIGAFDGDPKLSEVAKESRTSHQNTKQVLLKLKKQGYVNIYKDVEDKRINRVRVTDKAIDFWKNRDENDERVMNSIFEDVSTENLKLMCRDLMKIMDTLKRMDSV